MAILSSSSLDGNNVVNRQGEDLGSIKDFMIDTDSGRVVYAVLSFGGFLGLGDKLFAVPLQALELDTVNERFIFDVNKEQLENAPGFNQDDWPSTADQDWVNSVYSYYEVDPYYSTTY